ncbi:MAG TPA: acetoacetate--CoA ligase, partial [Polyangiaceae bacterium]
MNEPDALAAKSALGSVEEGGVLWRPTPEALERTNLTGYMNWLEEKRGLVFQDYAELWQWSVRELEAFWESIWQYFGVVERKPYRRVLAERKMPGAKWFEGALLNYAEHALRRRDRRPALVYRGEDGASTELSSLELFERVERARAGLRRLGVGKSDRVAALLPNGPEAVIAALATASLGAIWSSCPPEFGVRSVLDRFSQIEPKVVLAVDGYRYGGKTFDRTSAVSEIVDALPGVKKTVLLSFLGASGLGDRSVMSFDELLSEREPMEFEPVPFDHPLWVLYSSGTTGLPKPIVHGHGGILLEHYKALSLHCDLGPDDRFFWFTTTGWMMWNFLISGLLVGSTVVLYDGSPAYPDLNALWRLAEHERITYFGTSAPFLLACKKAGIQPARDFHFEKLKAVGVTGAPLPPDGFDWVYSNVSGDILLGSLSGGTDLCTAFVLPCPLEEVRRGEIQCRGLGAKVEAFNEAGKSVVGEVGELVLTEPMPSMPVFLWGDADGSRYHESYFDMYDGVWRHGDWIRITERGSCIIYGRSDSTLNRGGVRMGTSEFYRLVEQLPEVSDSLVIDTSRLGTEDGKLWLFIVVAHGKELDDSLRNSICDLLRRELSPRHVPDEIHAVSEIPRTLNG